MTGRSLQKVGGNVHSFRNEDRRHGEREQPVQYGAGSFRFERPEVCHLRLTEDPHAALRYAVSVADERQARRGDVSIARLTI